MILPTLEPIRDENLPEFCRFLCENLSRERSAEEWAKAFAQDWCPSKPNNGFLIRHEGRIVGGIGAGACWTHSVPKACALRWQSPHSQDSI